MTAIYCNLYISIYIICNRNTLFKANSLSCINYLIKLSFYYRRHYIVLVHQM